MSSEWTSCRLADCLTDEFPGEWGTEAKDDGTDATVLRATDIDDDGHVDLLGGSIRNIDPQKVSKKRLQRGDILLEASGGGPGKPVGRVALFDPLRDGIYLSSNFFRTLRPNSRVEPRFLAYALQRLHLLPAIWRFQQQTTGIINLKVQEYLEHLVEVPNRFEQRRIAEILDTVDEAIRRTEQVIEKLQQMKQGLLHDLLTRGIDDNGELRPPPEEAPHLYKDSPLGLIPSEWEVRDFGNACSLIKDGSHLPPARVEDGPYLFSVQNLSDGTLRATGKDTRVSWAFYRSMHRHWKPETGDVLLAIVGATIGKAAIVPPLPPFTLQRSVAVIRGVPGVLDNTFLYAVLSGREFQNRLWMGVNQTAQPGIYLEALADMLLALPSIEEQHGIVRIWASAESKCQMERRLIHKLRTLKKGLMDDLLTGRVRVNVPEGEC